MQRGGKLLLASAILAVPACGMEQGKLDIRSTPSAIARGSHPVPQRIAEGRGQLALGNVGLALEAFRLARRDDPNSTAALAGMADCYDRMGRFDLSRRYYETALALAPADPELLGAFAASLQLQGLNGEALKVRQEVAARSASPIAAEPTPALAVHPAPDLADSAPAPMPAARTAIAPVASKPVPPASLPASGVVAEPAPAAPTFAPIPRPELAASPVRIAADAAAPSRVALTLPQQKTELAVEAPPSELNIPVQTANTAPVGPSVTVKLPPARRVSAAAPAAAAAAVAPPVAARTAAAPVETAEAGLPALRPYPRQNAEPSLVRDAGPHLERLSLGEIALISTPGPLWRTTTVAHTDRSATVRFVSVRSASTLPVKVRLLNAARVQRLAANTRNWLAARGWRGMAIGNANAPRQRSVILYSGDTRRLAQRLSRQFGFPLAPHKSPERQVMVLLGVDAARHPALRRRG